MNIHEFRPTPFDAPLSVFFPSEDPRRAWHALEGAALSRSGSAPKDRATFRNKVRQLGGECATVEVHRFNHWQLGWFEVVLYDPAHEATLRRAQRMQRKHEDEDRAR
jgi:hypothetical protein